MLHAYPRAGRYWPRSIGGESGPLSPAGPAAHLRGEPTAQRAAALQGPPGDGPPFTLARPRQPLPCVRSLLAPHRAIPPASERSPPGISGAVWPPVTLGHPALIRAARQSSICRPPTLLNPIRPTIGTPTDGTGPLRVFH